MEITALILVNFLTAAAMYAFFSLKIQKAAEQAPHRQIMAELRENVESTIEYINQAIEIIQTENQSHYKMLKRGDEIVKKLEELTGKPAGKKALKKALSEEEEKRPGKNTSGKTSDVLLSEKIRQESDEIPDYLSRVMQRQDSVEIQGAGQDIESIFRSNQKSSPVPDSRPRTDQEQGSAVSGVLSKIGSVFFTGLTGQKMPRIPKETAEFTSEAAPQVRLEPRNVPPVKNQALTFEETLSMAQENLEKKAEKLYTEKPAAYFEKSEEPDLAQNDAAARLMQMISAAGTREARQEVILKMLEAGLDPADIQKISGFSKAEIDLIRLLSAGKSGVRPRKERYIPQ